MSATGLATSVVVVVVVMEGGRRGDGDESCERWCTQHAR